MKKLGILIVLGILMVLPFVYSQLENQSEKREVSQEKQQLTPEQEYAFNLAMKLYSTNIICVDSDGGEVFEIKGFTKQEIKANIIKRIIVILRAFFSGVDERDLRRSIQNREDYCGVKEGEDFISFIQKEKGKKGLIEYVCEGNIVKEKFVVCSNGCNNGRCIQNGEDIKPERAVLGMITFSNQGENEPGKVLNEKIGSVRLELGIPQVAHFIKNQEEANYFYNPNFPKPSNMEFLVLTLKEISLEGISIVLNADITSEPKLIENEKEIVLSPNIPKIIGNYKLTSGIESREGDIIPIVVEYLGTMEQTKIIDYPKKGK